MPAEPRSSGSGGPGAGTFADMADDFNSISPLLYDHGYCVFALSCGSNLTDVLTT